MRAIAVVVALLSAAGHAAAFCPHPTPKACSAFFESDAVFVGTVVSREYRDDDEVIRFVVRVSKVLRGNVGELVDVYTGNDSTRLTWEIGEERVVFAHLRDGRLESMNDCGPLSEPGSVAETLRRIEELHGETSAWIEGEIRQPAREGPGMPEVIVRVQGEGRTFEARTDDGGAFRIQVPPGHYEVLVDPGLRISDYNGPIPDDVHLVAGQCIQLQFVPR